MRIAKQYAVEADQWLDRLHFQCNQLTMDENHYASTVAL